MRRASRDPEPRLLFPQPVSAGGARSSGWWPEPGGGWVSGTRRAASAWPGRPETFETAARTPTWERAEPRRTWAGSGSAPRSRAGGLLSRGPAYAGPGGSGPPGRRGPLRGGGRAHQPPGKLSRDFSKLLFAEDPHPWLPPLLVFHPPPPSIVPTHGGPGPGRRRRLLQTWSCHCPSFRERTFL